VPHLAEKLAWVRARIAAAADRAGRRADEVALLPVTKTLDLATIEEAMRLGLTRFGENRVQDLRMKALALWTRPASFAQIGHLQTNKAADVARYASEFHALDSLRVTDALHRELSRLERAILVYVQVNTSSEPSKYGVEPGEAVALAREVAARRTLIPRGFMTLALHTTNPAAVRACFKTLRQVRDEAIVTLGGDWAGLSMGMSGDFEIAIEEGATCVRLGQALFGPRATPDSEYWPGAELARADAGTGARS
jgi:pyridoxal phosphate enzyme (YggS family)